jgi:hypothetical protein
VIAYVVAFLALFGLCSFILDSIGVSETAQYYLPWVMCGPIIYAIVRKGEYGKFDLKGGVLLVLGLLVFFFGMAILWFPLWFLISWTDSEEHLSFFATLKEAFALLGGCLLVITAFVTLLSLILRKRPGTIIKLAWNELPFFPRKEKAAD